MENKYFDKGNYSYAIEYKHSGFSEDFEKVVIDGVEEERRIKIYAEWKAKFSIARGVIYTKLLRYVDKNFNEYIPDYEMINDFNEIITIFKRRL